MLIHFRLLFRRASEPSSSDRTAKQQIAYAQNSSIIQEIRPAQFDNRPMLLSTGQISNYKRRR